jgi:hypothetical protein
VGDQRSAITTIFRTGPASARPYAEPITIPCPDAGPPCSANLHDAERGTKDLGSDTARIAAAMTTFDPDLTWAHITLTNE